MPLTSRTRKRANKQRPNSLVSRAPHPLVAIASAIFGYLLWLHFHLFVKSNSHEFVPTHQADDAPVTRVRRTPGSSLSLHLKKLAKDLTTSYSAQDGIASVDRQGFEISLLDQGSKSTCFCDIISTDCLHMIDCLTDMHNPQKRNARTWMGMELRRAMKANAEYETFRLDHAFKVRVLPLGKNLQYSTIGSWRAWRTRNVIYEYNKKINSIFVQPNHYPDCHGKDNGKFHPKVTHHGTSCFYRSAKAPEESNGLIIEDEAKRWYNTTVEDGKKTKKEIRKILDEFLLKHRPLPKIYEKQSGSGDFVRPESDSSDLAAAEYNADLSALGNLVLFAHMARIKFNRRPFLDKIYREQLTAVVVPKSEIPAGGENDNADINDKDPFIVSLHMRRGDSCGDPDPMNYERKASPLDSRQQVGGERLCYHTKVYLDAVARIRQLVPRTRPLHVYLSTDDVGNVMSDIFTSIYQGERTKDGLLNEVSSDDLGVEKWYFLNITRDHFLHRSDTIEAEENYENQPKLGETAVTDLWLLSHGHAFVGHLGSRFGKVSWLLATARRNNFVPFFSVDGHSFCCEIDEHCANAKPYITVDNCLTFGHEYSEYDHDEYWEKGSLARRERAMKDRGRRTKKQENNDDHPKENEK